MPRSSWSTLKVGCAVCLGVAVGVVARPAPAGEPAADAPSQKPLIVLAVPDLPETDVDERAAGTLAAHVRSAGARVRVVRQEPGELDLRALLADATALAEAWGARGVIWIAMERGPAASIYLFERERGQLFGRRVPLASGQTSAALESLANIAGAAAAEMLEGRVVGMAPVEIDAPPRSTSPGPEPPAAASSSVTLPAPAPTPRASESALPAPPAPGDRENERRWPRLGLAAGYTGNTFGADSSWQSALSLLVSFELSRHASIGLGYDFVFPQHFGPEQAGFDLQRRPIILTGGYSFALGGRWDFGVGARATLDFLTLERNADAPPIGAGAPGQPGLFVRLAPAGSTTDVVFSLAPVLSVGFRITDWVRLVGQGGIDMPLLAPPTLVGSGFDPSRARLLAGAALEVDLFVPEKKRTHSTTARR